MGGKEEKASLWGLGFTPRKGEVSRTPDEVRKSPAWRKSQQSSVCISGRDLGGISLQKRDATSDVQLVVTHPSLPNPKWHGTNRGIPLHQRVGDQRQRVLAQQRPLHPRVESELQYLLLARGRQGKEERAEAKGV